MKKIVFIVSVLFLFSLAACTKGESASMETGASGTESTSHSMAEKEDPLKEGSVSGEETRPKDNKYIEAYKAYLTILTEKSEEIHFPGNADVEVAILDVFGNKTPELLYTYWHDYTDEQGFTYPVLSLKIFSYSKSEGAESVFDSIVSIAAGGPNNYCAYLTYEGELMLYRSGSGMPRGWGFWKIEPNNNLIENTKENWGNGGNYGSDSAVLFLTGFDNNGELGFIYKQNGEEISKEQYDKAAMQIMGDVDRIIFQNVEPDDEWDVLWKNITPFEAENMTYDEAIAWLEAQIGNQ